MGTGLLTAAPGRLAEACGQHRLGPRHPAPDETGRVLQIEHDRCRRRAAGAVAEGPQPVNALPLGELHRPQALNETAAQNHPGLLHASQHRHERHEPSRPAEGQGEVAADDPVAVHQ